MKKKTLIQIIIIVVLVTILGILLKFTIDSINKNNSPQMANQEKGDLGGNMQGQLGNKSSSIT